jgi:DNA-binding MarR family transcriptional regulator
MNRAKAVAPAPASLFALLHTANAAQSQVEEKLAEIGLSLAKLAALSALAEAGEPMPLTQLAERLSCVKSNITQLVDRLEKDGLVERRAAAGDRRTRLAALTTAGKKRWKAGSRIQQDSEHDVFKRLSRQEAAQLAVLMEKVAAKP